MLSSRPIQLNTDGAHFPTRTPGRALKNNRSENAYAGMGAAMTVHGKGKNANMPPKTPFQPASAQPRLFKDHQKTILSTIGRPLGDKTPLPNRINAVLFKTPLPGNTKLSKLRVDEEEGTPESAQRPSSMRKHIKHPRLSGGKPLETPANNGRHWEEVSDGELAAPQVQPTAQETILEDGDDSDELEYGPPNTLDLPYDPPFDFPLPNYADVGRSLFQLAHSIPIDDFAPPVEIDIALSDIEMAKYELNPLPELESDDPFDMARAEIAAKSVKSTTVRRIPAAAAVKSRPQSSMARTTTVNTATRPTSRAGTAVGKKLALSTTIPAKSSTAAPRPKSRTASTVPNIMATKKDPTSTVKETKTTRVTSAGAPSIKPRVDTGLRRPHTALAIPQRSASKPRTHTNQKSAVSTSASMTDILIKHMGDDLDEELDFRFEV